MQLLPPSATSSPLPIIAPATKTEKSDRCLQIPEQSFPADLFLDLNKLAPTGAPKFEIFDQKENSDLSEAANQNAQSPAIDFRPAIPEHRYYCLEAPKDGPRTPSWLEDAPDISLRAFSSGKEFLFGANHTFSTKHQFIKLDKFINDLKPASLQAGMNYKRMLAQYMAYDFFYRLGVGPSFDMAMAFTDEAPAAISCTAMLRGEELEHRRLPISRMDGKATATCYIAGCNDIQCCPDGEPNGLVHNVMRVKGHDMVFDHFCEENVEPSISLEMLPDKSIRSSLGHSRAEVTNDLDRSFRRTVEFIRKHDHYLQRYPEYVGNRMKIYQSIILLHQQWEDRINSMKE